MKEINIVYLEIIIENALFFSNRILMFISEEDY